MMQGVVYWIRSTEHANLSVEGYIGVTTLDRFERRMWEHNHQSGNRYLANAIRKYGWNNLVKEVLLIGTVEYCLSIESKLRSEDKVGWNLVKGGGMPPSSLGRKFKKTQPAWNKGTAWDTESKEKISNGVKNLWKDPVYREHMRKAHRGKPSAMRGRRHTDEAKQKLRLAKLGVPSSKKGRKIPEDMRLRMVELARQEAWTCPHCQKQGYSKGAGNRWHFDNCRSKVLA